MRYYSIDLLFKLSKSDSANLDNFVLLRIARLKFDEETSVSLNSNYGFGLMLILGTILSLTMGVLLVRICILINLNFHQSILIYNVNIVDTIWRIFVVFKFRLEYCNFVLYYSLRGRYCFINILHAYKVTRTINVNEC